MVTSPVTPSRVVLGIGMAALVGLSIFGRLVYQAVDVQEASQSEALTRFSAARGAFLNQVPMLEVDASGRITRVTPPPASLAAGARELKSLEVLAYRAAEHRLIVAHVPFWFFSMKRPALQLAVRGTGLDLDRLQLTAENLSRHDPGLVLDQSLPNGDRLLVWTE
ncbi:MAG: hypothetical protein JJE39_00300 [Vicinamibacteria bacterium]|nr:hypothetical protein [Vicinamibacteria bacterium]